MTIAIDFKNYLFRNAILKISECQIYKRTFAKFHFSKKNRNSNLLESSKDFVEEYSVNTKKGYNVSDIKILNQKNEFVEIELIDHKKFNAINFATNSYNDLDTELKPREQLANYVLNSPISSCLSRKIAGRLPIHTELEDEISNFLELESSVLATSGYIAQEATMFALFSNDDIIFSDQHNHSSLVDGMKLTNAKVIVFPHLDYNALEKLIIKHRHKYNSAGIVSDGVFSAHGTIADLDKITQLKNKYNLISVIDDTHGFSTIGKKKRGILDFYNSKPDIITASLAKGLAGFGGVIAGSANLVKVIDCFGRQNINTSHLSPLVTAQSLYNLKFLRENIESLTSDLESNIQFFNDELDKLGIKQYQDSKKYSHPIFSFFAENEDKGIKAYYKLLEAGFVGAFFPPPVSPMPTIRLSLHRKIAKEDLKKLAKILAENNLIPLSKEYWNKTNLI